MGILQDLPVCDLRYISDAEAARQISEITDVALLLLPKDADPAVAAALAAIPKSDIGSTLYLGVDEDVQTINGMVELNDKTVRPDSIATYIVNGIAIVSNPPATAQIKLHLNGVLVFQESARSAAVVSIQALNGIQKIIDFDECKPYQNHLRLDAETLSYFSPNTLIVVGNQLEIAEDVTVQMLRDKRLTILVGNELCCSDALLPYLNATATVGNQILSYSQKGAE